MSHSVKLATTTHVVLRGLSPVDGVAPVDGWPILVMHQIDPAENGVYLARADNWLRITTPGGVSRLYVELGVCFERTTWAPLANGCFSRVA